MTSTKSLTAYFGTFVHPQNLQKLEILLKATIGVDNKTGEIVFVDKDSKSPEEALSKAGVDPKSAVCTTDSIDFFFTSLINIHTNFVFTVIYRKL